MTEVSHADLADDVIAVTSMLRRRLRRVANVPFPDERLTAAQAELIRHVRRCPGCTVSDAAAALGLASNTVSTLVRTLTRAGHLVRTPDPGDGRVVRLDLTPDTRLQVERWRDRRHALVADALAHLPDDRRRALADGLGVLDELTDSLADRKASRDD